MDKKLTDSEIVKALECCFKGLECKNCPANPHKGNYGYCTSLLLKDTLDLINRQKSEIERLRYNLEAVLDERADHSEAYKEFAERLKKKMVKHNFKYADTLFSANVATAPMVDNLLKEMEGDNNA